MNRPSRRIGMPDLPQRCAVETGKPRKSAIAVHPFKGPLCVLRESDFVERFTAIRHRNQPRPMYGLPYSKILACPTNLYATSFAGCDSMKLRMTRITRSSPAAVLIIAW